MYIASRRLGVAILSGLPFRAKPSFESPLELIKDLKFKTFC